MQAPEGVGANVQPDGWPSLAMDMWRHVKRLQDENQFLREQVMRLKGCIAGRDDMVDIGDPYSVYTPWVNRDE